MDSGYEAVLVDVNVATTNGINGTHEEVPEMKTRSKVTAGDASAADEDSKPRIRLTRTTMVQNDKDGSDSEKKDKKKNLRSGAGDAEEAAKPTAGAATGTTKAPTAPLPSAKKKALERDDDSGINSRASSVSNDDVATPARMRTRSSRTSEIASTSTPAERRGAATRVPLSIYEYDAASFDDDLPLAATLGSKSAAQKRKAVVYVEEMEDEEAAPEGDSAEPAAKRSATFLVSAGAGIVTSLLYPWRKLRSGIAAIRPFKAQPSADAASAEPQPESGADCAAAAPADESMDTSALQASETPAPSEEQPAADDAQNTCSLM